MFDGEWAEKTILVLLSTRMIDFFLRPQISGGASSDL